MMIGTSMFVEHPIPESNISIDVMNGSWTLCCSLRRWHAILSRAARVKSFEGRNYSGRLYRMVNLL
jgi:hypothetical protein